MENRKERKLGIRRLRKLLSRNVIRSISSVVTLAGSNLLNNKRRSLNLVLGFIIASSLLSSLLIWNETSTKLAILDSFEAKDFEISVIPKSGLSEAHLLDQVEAWLENQTMIEKALQLYQSPAVFGSEDLNDSVQFVGESLQHKIIITPEETVFFLENDFLQIAKDQFIFEGKFQLAPGELIISRNLIRDLQDQFNRTFEVNSTLAFSSMMAKRTTFDQYLANLSRFHFTDYKIVGIYERIPRKTLTELSYNSETLGEGIFLLREEINFTNEETLEKNDYRPKLFARIDRNYFSRLSFSSIEPALESLEARIRSLYPQTFVNLEIDDIKSTLSQYSSSFTFTFFLALPLIILSAFLISFTTRMVLQARSSEIGVLRARGATAAQLIAVLCVEFLLIALFGVTLGIAIGFAFAAAIPASDSFLILNIEEFLEQLTQLSFSPLELWLVSASFCILLVTLSSFWRINEFLSSEISDVLRQGKDRSSRIRTLFSLESPLSFSLAFAVLTGMFAVFVFTVFRKGLSAQYGHSTWMLVMFLGVLFFWTIYSKAFSRLMGVILPIVPRYLTWLFGPHTFLVSKSLKRRGNQLIPLIMILVFSFSIITFAVVNSETIEANTENQADYVIGADFKIRTRAVPPAFGDVLANTSGIKDATHILATFGSVGKFSVTVLGIDPIALEEIAYWDETTFPSFKAKEVMKSLLFNPEGIIINEFLADYLEADIGDPVTLFELGGQLLETYNFTVVATAHSFPAFGLANEFEGEHRPFGQNGGLVILNEGILAGTLNVESSSLFLAQMKDGADPQEIIATLEDFQEVIYVFSPDQADKGDLGFFSLVGTSGMATIVFILTGLISFVSLTAFLSYLIQQRQTEYAIMRSAGATKKQIILLVIEEFLGTIVFTFFAGVFLGLVFSFLYLTIGESLVSLAGILPMMIVIPYEFIFGSLALVVLTILISGLIPARKAGSTEVALTLRNL